MRSVTTSASRSWVSSMPPGTRPTWSPSGSVSLARAATETVRPGRTVISSSTATGAWLVSAGRAMPTWTVPTAVAPRASSTE